MIRGELFRSFPKSGKPQIAGWPFTDILTVDLDVTNKKVDYHSLEDAHEAAEDGYAIWLNPGLYTLDSMFTISKSIMLYGLDPRLVTIAQTDDLLDTISVTADDVVLSGLTINNIGVENFENCVRSQKDNLVINDCILHHSGNSLTSIALYNFGGADWEVWNSVLRVSDGITGNAYVTDDAPSSCKIFGGVLDGKTNAVRVNNASAVVELYDPVITVDSFDENNGTITGTYFVSASGDRKLTISGQAVINTRTPPVSTSGLHVRGRGTANYRGLSFSDVDTDATGKGAMAIVGPRHTNANAPFTVLGQWDFGSGVGNRVVYYGGGGWSMPDPTEHRFHAASTYTETADTGVRIALIDATGLYLGATATNPAFLLQLNADSAAKPTSNTWTISSDPRLKRRRSLYNRGLAWLKSLPKLITWTYNGLAGTPKTDSSIGFDAKELNKIAPEMVRKSKQKLHEKDAKAREVLGVNDHELKYAMLNAILELSDKIDDLERRLKLLEIL
jgi:hypothetical protein